MTFVLGVKAHRRQHPTVHRFECISIDVPLRYAKFQTNSPILIKQKLFSFSQCALTVIHLILHITNT